MTAVSPDDENCRSVSVLPFSVTEPDERSKTDESPLDPESCMPANVTACDAL